MSRTGTDAGLRREVASLDQRCATMADDLSALRVRLDAAEDELDRLRSLASSGRRVLDRLRSTLDGRGRMKLSNELELVFLRMTHRTEAKP